MMRRQYETDFAKWSAKMIKRLSSAVGASLDEIVRETKRALNRTGPNKQLQKAFGIRATSGPHSQAKGISALADLQELKIGKTTIFWGGKFTDDAGNKHGRIYWYGEPLNKWVQASPVGEPPFKQSGTLQKAITRELERSASGSVISGRAGPADELVYARRHELGGPGSYPARPYLLPTFNKLKAKIQARLKAAVKGNMK